MYESDIEVCSVCHFRLPKVMGYAGIIRCHCGKVVFDSNPIVCDTNATTNLIDYKTNISCLCHSSSLLS